MAQSADKTVKLIPPNLKRTYADNNTDKIENGNKVVTTNKKRKLQPYKDDSQTVIRVTRRRKVTIQCGKNTKPRRTVSDVRNRIVRKVSLHRQCKMIGQVRGHKNTVINKNQTISNKNTTLRKNGVNRAMNNTKKIQKSRQLQRKIIVRKKPSRKRKCDICKQFFSNAQIHQAPARAQNESKALLCEKLNFGSTSESSEKIQMYITDFLVYDKEGHLCAIDGGLIERNVELYMSGYLKPLSSYSKEVDADSVPAKDIGPIQDWFMEGMYGGDNLFVTLVTELGEYILMKPNKEYTNLMNPLYEKFWISKVVVKFLNDNHFEEPTYQSLLSFVTQESIPEMDNIKISEKMLHTHAQSVTEDIINMGTEENIDKPFVSLPCMQELIIKAGVDVRKHRRRRTFFFKRNTKKSFTKAVTTPLVREIFERFFREQVDETTKNKYNKKRFLKIRCKKCEACKRSDCGKCKTCIENASYSSQSRKKRCLCRVCFKYKSKKAKFNKMLKAKHKSKKLSRKRNKTHKIQKQHNNIKDMKNKQNQSSKITRKPKNHERQIKKNIKRQKKFKPSESDTVKKVEQHKEDVNKQKHIKKKKIGNKKNRTKVEKEKKNSHNKSSENNTLKSDKINQNDKEHQERIKKHKLKQKIKIAKIKKQKTECKSEHDITKNDENIQIDKESLEKINTSDIKTEQLENDKNQKDKESLDKIIQHKIKHMKNKTKNKKEKTDTKIEKSEKDTIKNDEKIQKDEEGQENIRKHKKKHKKNKTKIKEQKMGTKNEQFENGNEKESQEKIKKHKIKHKKKKTKNKTHKTEQSENSIINNDEKNPKDREIQKKKNKHKRSHNKKIEKNKKQKTDNENEHIEEDTIKNDQKNRKNKDNHEKITKHKIKHTVKKTKIKKQKTKGKNKQSEKNTTKSNKKKQKDKNIKKHNAKKSTSKEKKKDTKHKKSHKTQVLNTEQPQQRYLLPPWRRVKKETRFLVLNIPGYRRIIWIGDPIITEGSKTYYEKVDVNGIVYKVGDYVKLTKRFMGFSAITRLVYIWKVSSVPRYGFFHGEIFIKSNQTVLGVVGNPKEIFLQGQCIHAANLAKLHSHVKVEIKGTPNDWFELGGNQINESEYGRKTYFCQKYYDIYSARFEDLPVDAPCKNPLRQHRFCPTCDKEAKKDLKTLPRLLDQIPEKSEFVPETNRTEWSLLRWYDHDYKKGSGVFLKSGAFKLNNSLIIKKTVNRPKKVDETIYTEYFRKTLKKSKRVRGSNVSTKQPFSVGCIAAITAKSFDELIRPFDIYLKVYILFRPENTTKKKPLEEDTNVVYWSDEVFDVPITAVEGPCDLRYHKNIPKTVPLLSWLEEDPSRFYFKKAYDRQTGKFKPVSETGANIGDVIKKQRRLNKVSGNTEEEIPDDSVKPLRTMDVFSGCGGLSEGLHQAGIADCRWAIDNMEAATQAYSLNNKTCTVFNEDCNIFLTMVMSGATHNPDGVKLPQKGDVDLLCGGPPCQGFSGMNRFNTGDYSKFQNSLIVSFLSYCDYYRPKYFVLENVRNFVSFKKGMVLKLTLQALVTMGYQCTFGILQAGCYGVPQTRRRLIIFAAAPGYKLPSYPEPTHAFNESGCDLSARVNGRTITTNAQWWSSGPKRTCTIRDAMGDLPVIYNGADRLEINYENLPKTHFQRLVRHKDRNARLRDHICKQMSPLILARIARIPTTPGCDWRDLPNIEVTLIDGTKCKVLQYKHFDKKNGNSTKGAFRGVCACSSGKPCNRVDRQENTIIPWCLPHTANRNNNFAGLYGRISWDGFFSTTVTNPEPMGKQGRVLHPEQNRVVSVRECARSQGFADTFRFAGSILDKYRQVGNAVPPPLGAAIGREIKRALTKDPEADTRINTLVSWFWHNYSTSRD